MSTTPNFSQPAIFSEVSTPVAPDAGYLKVYGKGGALCSIANGGSEKTYATSIDLSEYLPLAGGTLTGDLNFTDATYDIGKSGETRPRDGFFSRYLNAGSDITSGTGTYWGLNSFNVYVGNNLVQYRLNTGSIYMSFSHAQYMTLEYRTALAWAPTGQANQTPDLLIIRDGAGVLHQRNSTNAQTFRVCNTYTSSTSYEAGVLDWQTEANVLCFGTVKGSGGGSARQLKIVTDGTAALTISTAQAVTASSTLTAVGTITSQGAISNDRYAATPLFRVRRAGGTSSSPTQVTNAQTIGIIGSYGYHDGGAFHSNTGASIQFISTEDYTATAQGTEIRFATADAGSTSATTRLTIEDNGVFSFQKLVGQETEVTGTPSGTTQTLTMNNGNHQTLALTSSTGNVTVTLTVPDRSAAGTIIVKQHGSTPRDITWAVSSGTIKWMGTEPTWNGDAASDVRIVSWRWNGSVMYLMSTDVAS